jgi:integrase
MVIFLVTCCYPKISRIPPDWDHSGTTDGLMKARISKRFIDALQPGQTIADTEIIGFRARCLASGAVVYDLRYRNGDGQRRPYRLGRHGSITADEARVLAKKRSGEIADNRDPIAERAKQETAAENTVNALLDNYIKREVHGRALRSAPAIASAFDRLVRPKLGKRSIYDLKKSDLAGLHDDITDDSGPVMADRALAYIRAAFRWHADRDDDFRPPMIKARTKPSERQRARFLNDQEIRDLWAALDLVGDQVPASYPAFIRALLLSGQRRTNVSHIHREEIAGDQWVIPGSRMKHKKPHLVPITSALQRLFGNRRGFLFSSDDGKTPFSGYSKAKKALDKTLADLRGRKRPMPHWTLHDLRRTARSVMSRYATPDIAERVIGHVIGGVRGVYDLYEYADEKRAALDKLAAHIEGIVQ